MSMSNTRSQKTELTFEHSVECNVKQAPTPVPKYFFEVFAIPDTH